LWYAKFMNPRSVREKYNDGFWLQFYIYKDLEYLFARQNDGYMLKKLHKAYFSSDWKSLTK